MRKNSDKKSHGLMGGVLAAVLVVGFVLVPIFGFRAACLGSPIAWVFADAFLIPAFLHVYRKLQEQLKYEESAAAPVIGKKLGLSHQKH